MLIGGFVSSHELLSCPLEGPSWMLHEAQPATYGPPTAAEMLGQLGAAEELAARLMCARWARVADCRRSGASWEQIGAVLDMTAAEACIRFRDWIERGRAATDLVLYPAYLDRLAVEDPGMDAAATPEGVAADSSS